MYAYAYAIEIAPIRRLAGHQKCSLKVLEPLLLLVIANAMNTIAKYP